MGKFAKPGNRAIIFLLSDKGALAVSVKAKFDEVAASNAVP